MNEKEELYKRIVELEARYQKNQSRRSITLFVGFSIIYFVIFSTLSEIDGIKSFLIFAYISLLLGGFHYFIHIGIFQWYFGNNLKENQLLDKLKDEYQKQLPPKFW